MRWRRKWRGTAAVVVVGIIGAGLTACSGNDNDNDGDSDARQADGDQVPLVGATLADLIATTPPPIERPDLDGLEDAGIAVERVEPELTDGERLVTDPMSEHVALVGGDTLLAWASSDESTLLSGEELLMSSADLGETWEAVELPGAPHGLVVHHSTHEVGGAGEQVVVVGSQGDVPTAAESSIWTSEDGVDWVGGPVQAAPPEAGLTDDVRRLADGRLAVGLYWPEQTPADPQTLTSEDDGASWQASGCPQAWRGSDDCSAPRASAGLWPGRAGVSFDEGATWRPVVIEPATSDPPDELLAAVSSPEGGWLGLTGRIDAAANRFMSLVRSDDGVRWEKVLDDGCDEIPRRDLGGDIGEGSVESVYDLPIALGDRWLVVHTCNVNWSPQRTELYLVDQAGNDAAKVATIDGPDIYFGQPIAVGDVVVVSEPDANDVTTFLQLSLPDPEGSADEVG